MLPRSAVTTLVAALLAGCTISRVTDPPRTATEELLISTAADRAADNLQVKIPHGTRVFVDTSQFAGTDDKYALGAITEHILRAGGRLVADRSKADWVLLPRAGALSIDKKQMLVGIPSFAVPVPLMGTLSLPELALFSEDVTRGTAKFAVVGYDANGGDLVAISGPSFGFSHKTHYVVMLAASWDANDILPKKVKS
jgi:hypothetical protein